MRRITSDKRHVKVSQSREHCCCSSGKFLVSNRLIFGLVVSYGSVWISGECLRWSGGTEWMGV